jgi:hypothetical protein
MLGFIIDMVNSYGSEIKTIADKDFVTTILNKLKAYKIKKYETDIMSQEEVIYNIY